MYDYEWIGDIGGYYHGSNNDSNDGSCYKHEWVWYQGFHMVRFYYCKKCDYKNTMRLGPNGEQPFLFNSEENAKK